MKHKDPLRGRHQTGKTPCSEIEGWGRSSEEKAAKRGSIMQAWTRHHGHTEPTSDRCGSTRRDVIEHPRSDDGGTAVQQRVHVMRQMVPQVALPPGVFAAGIAVAIDPVVP